jgi:2-polyprenyl-6-hydroxyphenyl methylase / 3-demethylubiquinone-9 3-methyltransferase
MAAKQAAYSIDPAEIAKFDRLAATWWDPHGPMRPLHRLNPTRLAYVRDRICGHFGRDPQARRPLAELSVLDIGCGGGLLAEPLARLGANVTGLDAAAENIRVAKAHANGLGLQIDYREATAEALADDGRGFDVVLALEVVEHVADVPAFVATAAELVKPGGALILSTLNRTPRAFLEAIVGAEYVLRWLPRGTHDWRRFLRPAELARLVRAQGLAVADIAGMSFNPLRGEWRLGDDTAVNYLLYASKS